MSLIEPWVSTLPSSDNRTGIELSIMLGNNCNSDDERSRYWSAIRSIGACMEGFPNKFKPKSRGPRDGTVLRMEFIEKLHKVSTRIKDSGRIIYDHGIPSLENLSIEARFCNNDLGLDKAEKVREVCAEYNIKDKNIHIYFRDCSPKRKIGLLRQRSGAYTGPNRWPL